MSDKYCVCEWYLVEPSTGDRHWVLTYNDGSIEILTMRAGQ